MSSSYVIGLDYGTDSVRAVLVDAGTGEVAATHVHWYQRWRQGLYCDPGKSQFRQHVQDHIEGAEATIKSVVITSGVAAEQIAGICIDTTGSSPIPVDQSGTPLCLLPEFADNPHAMMVLWKDHTAIAEAEEINQLARSWGGEDFTRYEGGVYSSEWFWAKILHIIRNEEDIRQAAHSWMEHCDLMSFLLTGVSDLKAFKRSRCAAGHKAMWHASWGGLPADEFLRQLHPDLVALKQNLYRETYTSDQVAGNLSSAWAERLGLNEDTVVAVGTFDAHAGAVGAGIEEYTLVRVMGTSTCDIVVSSSGTLEENTVKGICGQVDGSVIPGMVGLEAGQSAFGDVLAWFRDVLCWPLDHLPDENLSDQPLEKMKDDLIAKLSNEAEKIPLGSNDPLALDWINGRRTPDANQSLKAALTSLHLGTGAPEIFRALVESICFGSRRIVERFASEGVEIRNVVGIGGVAKKSGLVMQTLANVLNMPIKVAVSEQAPALGAAMYAAVASGIHPDTHQAIKAMGKGFEKTYVPDPETIEIYSTRYRKYLELGNFIEEQISTEHE